MPTFHSYQYPALPDTFVVRLMLSGDKTVGFVRQVGAEDDPEATYPSEQVPAEEALALAHSRSEALPGSRVYVELGEGVEWDPAWGELGS